MKIRLLTVVWGSEYADVFVRITLRTLLAKGNVLDLSHAHKVIYTVYTTADDEKILRAAPAFTRLCEAVDVRVSLFRPAEIDTSNYGSHGIFWQRGLDLARRNREVLFFVIPDLIYAQGTLLRWAQRFAEGAGAIFTLGPQVVLETILPELEGRFSDPNMNVELNRDQVFDLLCRHLHPLHAAMRHDSIRRPSHPEYDLRLVPKHGFVVREIVSHPFCIDPRCFSNLRHYGPEDHFDRLVFEPFSTVSVEPLVKRVNGYYRPRPLDETHLSNMAGWWDCFATKANAYESSFPFDLCTANGAVWQKERQRAVAAGQFYCTQLISAGKLYRLFVELRHRGLYRAASLLAAAVFAGRLRRRLPLRRGAILLVPTDKALDGSHLHFVLDLLKPGREREFIQLVADHVLPSKEEMAHSRRFGRISRNVEKSSAEDGALITARGLPAEPLLAFASSAGEPFSVGPFTIYPVDRVLWRNPPIMVANSPDATEPAAALAVFFDRPSPFVVTKWAQQSTARRLLFYLLHTPFLEPFVALLVPVYFFRHFKNRMRHVPAAHRWRTFFRVARPRLVSMVRDLTGKTRNVPLIGRLTRLLSLAVRNSREHGVRATAAKIVARAPFGETLLHFVRRSSAHIEFARRGIHVARRDGVVMAWRKMRVIFWKLSPVQALPSLPDEDLAIFQEIRSFRALQAVRDVLSDVQQKMGEDRFCSEPLALIEHLFEHDIVARSNNATSQLVELTKKHPTWADAWLELGYVRQDQGRVADALQCFAHAANGKRLGTTATDEPDVCALAAAEQGRLLAAAGLYQDASRILLACFNRDPSQKLAAVEYAKALCHLGQVREALSYYSEGMYYQETRWSLPPAPRKANDLSFARLSAPSVCRNSSTDGSHPPSTSPAI